MSFVIYLALILVGLVMGSFAGATVWRLRARQLAEDKKAGEKIDEDEYKHLKPLAKTAILKDHSRCLHCGYNLRWYDLIPLVSWISLKGRCRECKKKIGYFEPLMEIGVATFFVLSYTFWPSLFIGALPVAAFIIWLIAGVGLAILFAYDVKWLLLPDKVNIVVIGLGLISAILYIINAADHGEAIISVIASVGILSGLYLFLYVISKGKWIGFGDVKLGLGLGLLLGDWQLAFIGLFAANLIGTLIVIPSLLRGEMKRNTHVPFGPLLIAGTVVAQLAGPALIGMYVSGLV